MSQSPLVHELTLSLVGSWAVVHGEENKSGALDSSQSESLVTAAQAGSNGLLGRQLTLACESWQWAAPNSTIR